MKVRSSDPPWPKPLVLNMAEEQWGSKLSLPLWAPEVSIFWHFSHSSRCGQCQPLLSEVIFSVMYPSLHHLGHFTMLEPNPRPVPAARRKQVVGSELKNRILVKVISLKRGHECEPHSNFLLHKQWDWIYSYYGVTILMKRQMKIQLAISQGGRP